MNPIGVTCLDAPPSGIYVLLFELGSLNQPHFAAGCSTRVGRFNMEGMGGL